ncbi:MAG: putative amidohydrolase YtcJ [Planctomycetota bacterium]|jgi:predicted amidohydrolase YtcJ
MLWSMQAPQPRSLVLAVSLLLLAACRSAPEVLEAQPLPDGQALLFHGGTIYSGVVADEGQPGAQGDALLCVDGVVLALGELADLEARWQLAGIERVDLDGATAIPGLQDAHGHVASYGALLEQVDLAGSTSYEEVIERIVKHAAELPPGTWVTGRGWDQTLWPGAEFPEHGPLSAAVPGHPVFVRRVDGHAALANQMALQAAGLYDVVIEEPMIEGGRIHLDSSGKPTGVFIDTAMGAVGAQVPDAESGSMERAILAAQDQLLSLGLTCVHDMGIGREGVEIFQRLRDEGKLRLRIAAYLWGNGLQDAGGLRGLPLAPDAKDRFQVLGVKLMADGALGSRGAALLEPYHDAPHEQGLIRFDRAELLRLVRLCAQAGMQPATHAIGDAANRMVLDVYEQVAGEVAGMKTLRPRIEHAQVVAISDLQRLGELGVIPSVQPTHATSDMRWAEQRVGPERVLGAYAWRRMETPNSPLALGSDFPVEKADPLLGLYAAVTRQDASGSPAGGWYADQCLTPAEAAAAFAWGAAYAADQESRRGRLLPGYACDMSIFDRDLIGIGPGQAKRILGARCLLTVIDGQIEYDGR